MPDGVKTTIYLPDDLRPKIEDIAITERRSMNAAIVILIEEALKRRVEVAASAAFVGVP